MIKFAPLLALTLMPTVTLADPIMSTVTPDNEMTIAPTEWLGDHQHLVIMGRASGYMFDMQVTDFDEVNLHNLEVKREYLLTGTDYTPYREIDFGIQFKLDGVAKTIEAKLTQADFNKLGDMPNSLALQSAEEYPEGAQTYTEFEFEWEGNGKSVNEELAEWTGNAIVTHDTARGQAPNGDGMVGGYINATNGDDHIVISFTLPVTEFEVED